MPARTKRQSDVLRVIVQHIEDNGYRPSYQAIADELGLRARSGIARIVAELESQGLLERSNGDGRFSLELNDSAALASKDLVSILWLDDDREDLVVPSFMLGYQSQERIRALRVVDNAMLADGIAEDDVALVELRRSAKEGEIVAVVARGGVPMLRRYYRAGGDVELRSADGDADLTRRFSASQVEIRGVLRGLLKPIS
jgi:SOS-response transcriptional repressor LexA